MQAGSRDTNSWNDPSEFAFSDALNFHVEAPWEQPCEPTVVPGMFDGHHFVMARLLAMVGLAVGMVALLVLVLTSLVSLGSMLEGTWRVPAANTALPVERGGMEDANVRPNQSGRVENQKADAGSRSAER